MLSGTGFGEDKATWGVESQFRLVEIPLRAIASFVMAPLSRYDDLEEFDDRARTEELMAALRGGATFPPLVIVAPPYVPAAQAVRLLDGYHRASAYGNLRVTTVRAFELILPTASPLLEAPGRARRAR